MRSSAPQPRPETLELVKRYVIETFATDLEDNEPTNDLNLREVGIVTSLGMFHIVDWASATFSIPVDDIELSPTDFQTILDIASFIERHGPHQFSTTESAP